MAEHDCENLEEIRDITKAVGCLITDVAIVKRDTSDLKELSTSMSKCIEALTKSSIISQESHITREQFYTKFEEFASSRAEIMKTCATDFNTYKDEVDVVLDDLDKRITANKVVCDDFNDIKKMVYGIIVTITVFLIIEGYNLLIHRVI